MQRAHAIAFAFFDGYRDVGGLAVLGSHEWNRNWPAHARAGEIHRLNDRVFYDHLEISIVLVQAADADFEIFLQLWTVEGLRQDVDSSQGTKWNGGGA